MCYLVGHNCLEVQSELVVICKNMSENLSYKVSENLTTGLGDCLQEQFLSFPMCLSAPGVFLARSCTTRLK